MLCRLILFVCVVSISAALNNESRLHDKLLTTGYNPRLRPRLDPSLPVVVAVEYTLNTVADVDEIDQVMSTVGFIGAEWHDDFLQWDPAQFGGIKHLVLPPNAVWLPDFGIVNSADTFYELTFRRDFHVDVMYTGRVLWVFGGNFATTCTLDITYYPYDNQVCSITIENWMYSSDAVDLVNKTRGVVKRDFAPNGEWEVVNSAVVKSTFTDDSHPDKTFPRLTFSIHMERKPRYYYTNIITPCIFCVIIAIMVFWLPPESGEKVSLGITVLLAFSVFQLVVAENTPKTSDFTPLLTRLMTGIMGMATASILATINVVHFYHHNSTKRVPRWLRRVAFYYLAGLFCMRELVPGEDEPLPEPYTAGKDDPSLKRQASDQSPPAPTTPTLQNPGALTELREIRDMMRLMTSQMKDKARDSHIQEEWKALAMVLDRIFFWLTTITTFIMVPAFLLQPVPELDMD